MTPIARFVLRDGGDENDGLILGALMKAGRKIFAPGHVYEIQECMGEFIIRDVGVSWIKRTRKSGRFYRLDGTVREVDNDCCWGSDAGTILTLAGKCLVLTHFEFDQLVKHDAKET